MLTAAQLRAARGLLDWTRADLAKAANVSPETIKNIEHGTFRPQEATTKAIVNAFQTKNVEFTSDEGVRRVPVSIKVFNDAEGYELFLEDVYAVIAEAQGGYTRQFVSSDKIISTYCQDGGRSYMQKMEKFAEQVDSKCLIIEGDRTTPAKHCSYRWIPKEFGNLAAFYIYNDNIALVTEMDVEAKKISLICFKSKDLSKAFTTQFDTFWQMSKEIK